MSNVTNISSIHTTSSKLENSFLFSIVCSVVYIFRHSVFFFFSFLPIAMGINNKLSEISSPDEQERFLTALHGVAAIAIGCGCGLFNGALLMLIGGYFADVQGSGFYWTGGIVALFAIVTTRNGLLVRSIARRLRPLGI